MSEAILLGLLDEEFKSSSESSWDINKVGGRPDLMQQYEIPHCRICKDDSLIHVCQIYCPIGNSSYHRTLYLFACTNKKCWNNSGSWFVLRSQLLDKQTDEEVKDEEKNQNKVCGNAMFTDDWGVDADNWGDEDDGNEETLSEPIIAAVTDTTILPEQYVLAESKSISAVDTIQTDIVDFEKQTSRICIDDHEGNSTDNGDLYEESSHGADCTAEVASVYPESSCIVPYVSTCSNTEPTDKSDTSKLSKSNITENKSSFAYANYFVPYYINVFEETEGDQTETLYYENQLLKDYVQKEGIDLKLLMDHRESGFEEKYEKGVVKHGDDFFYKFVKRVAQCPHQILRYQYNGKPLLMKKLNNIVPDCESCGKRRQFEFQLMPSLVNLLKPHSKEKDCLLEFGTVLVYTCFDSCWDENKCRTEYVIVQSDPDQHLFKV